MSTLLHKITSNQIFKRSHNIPLKHSQFFREEKSFDYNFFGLTFTQRITCFFTCLVLGLFLFAYSMVNILTAFINPTRFALPYAVSNFLFFTMLGFIFGFRNYLLNVFGKKKRNYTSMFLFCTFATVYSALKFNSYVVNFVLAVMQVASFIVFALTFVPGGTQGVSSMVSLVTKR